MRLPDAVGERRLRNDDSRVSRDLDERRVGDGDDRRSRRHRLDDRQPESLVTRRLNEARGAAVELREVRCRDVPLEPRTARPQLVRHTLVLRRPDDDELEADLPRGGERRALVLPLLDRSDGEGVRRL